MWTKLLLIAIALSALPHGSHAQTYPARPIHLIVPFAPGAASDALARLVAERLRPIIGESVIVENRPGASGAIGSGQVAKAEPDGYTILLMPGGLVLAKYVSKSVPFELSELAPIGNLVFAPYVMYGAKNQPFNNLTEMVAYARANPEKLAVGNSELTTRLTAESMAQAGNFKLTHVSYKGGGPIVTDVLGGHLALGVGTPIGILQLYKEGRVLALGVSSPTRLATLPDVPTVAEALKIPSFDFQTWFALMAPAKTPRPILDRLQQGVVRMMAEPEMRKKLQEMGLEPAADNSSEGLANLMKTFAQRSGALVEAAGIKPE